MMFAVMFASAAQIATLKMEQKSLCSMLIMIKDPCTTGL